MEPNSLNRLVVHSTRGSLIVSAVLMATSACVYAQTSLDPGTHQLTRAEVRHELKELESVGYRPIPMISTTQVTFRRRNKGWRPNIKRKRMR